MNSRVLRRNWILLSLPSIFAVLFMTQGAGSTTTRADEDPVSAQQERRDCRATLEVTATVNKESDINDETDNWSFTVMTKKGKGKLVNYNFAFSGNGGATKTLRVYGPTVVGKKNDKIHVLVKILKPTEHDVGPSTGGVVPDDTGKEVEFINERVECPSTVTKTLAVPVPANPAGGTDGLEQDGELKVTVKCVLDP